MSQSVKLDWHSCFLDVLEDTTRDIVSLYVEMLSRRDSFTQTLGLFQAVLDTLHQTVDEFIVA